MLNNGKKLRKLLDEKDTIFTVGVGDPFMAKLADQTEGIDGILSSGFQISALDLGLPDVELYSKSDNRNVVSKMCDVIDKPLIADIDTAYGNAVSAIKTIQEFEKAGVAGVQIEDQISPKRCPVCVDNLNNLISAEEAANKIKAMADHRFYEDTVIIARTDAIEYDELLRRSKMYIEAGADIIQPISRALTNKKEYKKFVDDINFPVSMIAIGWMDELTEEEIREIGPKLCQFALTPINAIYPALKKSMDYIGKNHSNKNLPVDIVNHTELINFLGMPKVNKLEEKYLPKEEKAFE